MSGRITTQQQQAPLQQQPPQQQIQPLTAPKPEDGKGEEEEGEEGRERREYGRHDCVFP